MAHKTDIEIAREATKRPILEVGAKLGIGPRRCCPTDTTRPS
jgi:formate--tetrahydrofolate ligase